jgi:hypothetical protein
MASQFRQQLEPNLDLLAGRVAELRAGLKEADPYRLAQRTGARYHQADEGKGEFSLSWWGQGVILTFPDFELRLAGSSQALPSYQQAMLLYYFTTSDGIPPAGEWISFSDLPDGRFYNAAFQGYTGKLVAQTFGNNLVAFRQAAEGLGGVSLAFGDAAYAFQALPHLALSAVYWRGDEEFTPFCQILFDAAASHHLPTDACAVLGSNLARMLIKESGKIT